MQMQLETKGLSKSWVITLPFVVVVVVGIIALFYQTAWAMVSTWYRTETFAHGFVIVPISMWLIWEKRHVVSNIDPIPEYRVLALLTISGFVWLVGYMSSVMVVQQVAMVLMLIFGFWTLVGNRITWILAFPLAYLMFAVPMGKDLVPYLMEITATVTVYLIKLTGIPVFREGMFFSLPSGDWSVVEACSGVRYLIASITLGTLYAYLTYSDLTKRILFLIAATIVPIIANSLRAYMIVMLGHISDMKIATGVDHLIYGWLFFGLVMLILFSVGSIWRDKNEETNCQIEDGCSTKRVAEKKPLFFSVIMALTCVAVWPLLAYAIDHRQPSPPNSELSLPKTMAGWTETSVDQLSWHPAFRNADHVVHKLYRNGDKLILVSIGYYPRDSKDSELINSENQLVDITNKRWRIINSGVTSIRIKNDSVRVDEITLKGIDGTFEVFSWYRVGGYHTSSRYKGKLLEAYYKLTFGRQDGARFVITIPTQSVVNSKEKPDQAFLDKMITAVEIVLDTMADAN